MPLRGLPVLRSTMRLVAFQLGTLAFASLIVALVSCLYFPSSCAQPCRTRNDIIFPAGCRRNSCGWTGGWAARVLGWSLLLLHQALESATATQVWMLRMIVEWGAKKLKTLRSLPLAGTLLCVMTCCMRVLPPAALLATSRCPPSLPPAVASVFHLVPKRVVFFVAQ